MSIESEIARLKNAKEALKISIENKGVTVSDEVTLDGYSALVDSISSGSSDFDISDEYLKYFTYRIDSENKQIILYNILYDVTIAEFGYNVEIPNKIGNYDVVIASNL